MNYFTKDALISVLKNNSEWVELSAEDQGSVVISEYGGRPLGIFPKKDQFSLLWINPRLKERLQTHAWDIGGDRYWISPERDFFYKDPENWRDWFCPSGLDPANYELLGIKDRSCTVSSPLSVQNMRTKEQYAGEVTRQFTLVDDPLSSDLAYVGLEFIDDCVMFRPNVKMNGWSLATVLSGGPQNPGTVLIPTKKDPQPLSYFRNIPEDRLAIGKNYVSFKIDVDAIYKLAIRPEDVNFERKAKIGYMLKIPESEEWGLLVKRSDDIPKSQKECFDVSRDHPDLDIGVIQSYNSESPEKPLLNFGEIELQLSMFKTIDNTSHTKVTHQLLAYIGSKAEILHAAESLLGISDVILF